MKLKKLMTHVPFYQGSKDIENLEVTGISMDSRSVKKGDLFICQPGEQFDGHDFAEEAIRKGASAIVAEKSLDVSVPVIIVPDSSRAMAAVATVFYGYPTQDLRVIGITGTNGKTSVSYLLEAIFNKHKQRTGLIGTIKMKIGNKEFEVKNTTPDSLFLQKSFHDMKSAQVDTVIMEVSSHALDIGRVHGTDMDVAVFTNLSQDHLDYHESMEDYFHAKSLLFSQLGNNFIPGKKKFAVINEDDPVADRLIRSAAQPVITYGIEQEADVTANRIDLHAKGTSFWLETPNGKLFVNSKLMGKFNVYNMLAASASAIVSGVELSTIKAALEETTGVRGRFEPLLAGQPFGVVIDYAHTPDSLKNVLTTMREFCKGKIRTVVGCGGDRDRTKRPLMADVAMEYSDFQIFTSDNPRTEPPEQILDDMVGHLSGGFERIVDRKDAIQTALKKSLPGDMVLIAGKGHETYQEVNGKRFEFDDRKVAEEFLTRLKGSK
ncbi:UDP-N-acetylmuramoyl-L-alanyl-D-glutamate--2,6-diaminopimelate ligase [Thalassobacillus pellis]|uniref:UDP-N-acetylmuramoyl-L-alanyl-D-glutamate--2, 6-diaminopimelate ligase n=1 Tax=Thalassobacillus pellis TaxID=748008 RepID=UPI0019605646|nr:UDP-N-acetylmuramoyl-L-alanyl-D-glutamate--2,6-diaminopimelate ligase [Thalassobacillus pellis]MBM7552855.1 UDP-N-acetylmuramoyl-L-alanyl-D-glutamate--2,6-diaminopimelate ligase [Thalassobacillus pellis]